MWIVKIALQRPYTFIVLAVLLLIFGPLAILRTPTDILPNIGIPVVSVVWGYSGLSPNEMGSRVVGVYERVLPTTVNDIEHIESQSLSGVGVVKIFFQPGVNIDLAVSQITAVSQTVLRFLPPGMTPPLILNYNASTVPVLQLALTSLKLTEQELFDYGNSFIRTQLATVKGAALPFPFGGKQRQVQVDLDQQALQSHNLTSADVNAAIASQNLIMPAGTQKIGPYEYTVLLNASPTALDELNNLPIKVVNGSTIYIRDVANVHDGSAPQINIVRVDGQRAALMSVQKTGTASTLDIIEQIKARLPLIRDAAPSGLDIRPLADQSLFVRGAVEGVLREGLIAAALTGALILLFLGSWRSTLIITVSIPLSILASIITLSALGETINIMTLGGLALAVGILVDDATVAIENINWNLEQGKGVQEAILDGAHQIAVPALVSTLCICIVFVPMFFLSGVARFLFVPLAEAVVFAMLASYILSRTLVPTMAKYLLHAHGNEAHYAESKGAFHRFLIAFESGFDIVRKRYQSLLALALLNRRRFALAFFGIVVASFALFPFLGSDFFPQVDGGQIKLHMRAHAGIRVEETARLCDLVEATVRQTIPVDEIESVMDNIGLPFSGINLTYSNSAPIGTSDADILISLKPGHKPTADYARTLRKVLPDLFPGISFAFLPADIVSQILNFGLPSPIDVQVTGNNQQANLAYAQKVVEKVKHVPGIADLRIHQVFDNPQLMVNVDRSRARDLGFSQSDVASNVLISLSGSFQTSPNLWLNPKNGVSYNVVTQTPQFRMDSLETLSNIPVGLSPITGTQHILGSVATISHTSGPAVVSHYNVQPVIDIYGGVQDRDLGGVSADIASILHDTAGEVPKGSTVTMRGQTKTMDASFTGLYAGLTLSIVLVYLLIVVNFQSWLDPFIIITALPGALAGIVWMLFLTHTTLSIPALTGAIMCMGVATANSILMVSFARDRMDQGREPLTAALEAGAARFRPVLMTALAMIIGMIPMALGFGDGGEQNAPLGRAVIGGLTLATVATLFFVPTVFCLLHGRRRGILPTTDATL